MVGTAVDIGMYVLHVAFAALWTGGVLFLVLGVFPAARSGTIGNDVFRTIVDRMRWVTRIGAVVFLVTGGHLAASRYSIEALTGTGSGHLVLTMLGLWLVLVGVMEYGSTKLDAAVNRSGVSDAIEETRTIFLVAAALAILLLVDAGILASGLIA